MLADDWRCLDCGAVYGAPGGIPNLRLAADSPTTDIVRRFYEVAPFPGYAPGETLSSLRSRGARSEFARLLDDAIPGHARVLEIGCGTGQMSIFLARADRLVIGADMTRASLALGAAAAQRFGLSRIRFVETDLNRPGLRPGAFDVVICTGVLHHVANPRAAFARIVPLLRPGGIMVLGLYNAIARIPLRLRRIVARITGYRWIPFDPVLRDRAGEPERRTAWLRDQYQHPEEHRHTIAEVQCWLRENGMTYLATYPSSLMASPTQDLFAPAGDNWWLERWLTQLGWISSLGHEGGLFVTIGRR
jgi:2-polyprenyl-3-methyl-5-hydroxy-6-metoxy-1,4-benzoquinol methylase